MSVFARLLLNLNLWGRLSVALIFFEYRALLGINLQQILFLQAKGENKILPR
jgi:hypothetical protein